MRTNRTIIRGVALMLLHLIVHSPLCPAFAQDGPGTAFTYQGRLNDGPNPATGLYDFRFRLFSDEVGSSQVGGAILTDGVFVKNGLFTTAVDFGPGIFNGSNYWMEISVRTNGAGFYTALAPFQAVMPTPYATFARTAANLSGTISSANLSGTYSGPVTFNSASGNFSGQFSGNGANMTNVNATTLGGLNAASYWKTTGNGGTLGGVNFLGTTDNQPLELWVNGSRALRLEPNSSGVPNLVGGSSANFVASGTVGAVIAGGGATNYFGVKYTNSIAADFGTIGGGAVNQIQPYADGSVIVGGYNNRVQSHAFISTISGGQQNQAVGPLAAIGGGWGNQSIGIGSYIGAGGYDGISYFGNTNAGNASVIGGGLANSIQPGSSYSVIVGGQSNVIQSNAPASMVGGGEQNQIQSDHSTIGGGIANVIQTNSWQSVIGGGYLNQIQHHSSVSIIGTGQGSSIGSYSGNSAILGGAQNRIFDSASGSTIGGGYGNQIQTLAYYSFIGGGGQNLVLAGAGYATLGGGLQNVVSTNSQYTTLAGGFQNQIQSLADFSTISGGTQNTNLAPYATIPGGDRNVAGLHSFAAGHDAKANHTGTFVWGDSTDADFADTANDQFLIRASGGVGIGTTSPTAQLNVVGTGALGATFQEKVQNGDGPTLALGANSTAAEIQSQGGIPLYLNHGGNNVILLDSGGGNVGIGTASPDALLSVSGSADKPGGGSWSTFSDARLKDIGSKFTHGLKELEAIEPVRYHYKAGNPLDLPSEPEFIGVVAQQVEQSVPEAVSRRKDGYLVINNDPIIWTMVNAINELNERRQADDRAKDAEIANLKARLEKLEQLSRTRNGAAQ